MAIAIAKVSLESYESADVEEETKKKPKRITDEVAAFLCPLIDLVKDL